MRRNYRLYADPALVAGVADHLRCADTLIVRFTGVQHVFVTAESPQAILYALAPMEGWSLRDIQETV